MNGIEPPTPMSTGAVPSHAAANAARAASYAGPVASMTHGSPSPSSVTVDLRAPRRVLLQVRLSAWYALLRRVAGRDPHG